MLDDRPPENRSMQQPSLFDAEPASADSNRSTSGDMTRSIDIATRTYAAGSVLHQQHYHDGATLSLIFRGGSTERVGRRHHHCEPLAFVYKPPRGGPWAIGRGVGNTIWVTQMTETGLQDSRSLRNLSLTSRSRHAGIKVASRVRVRKAPRTNRRGALLAIEESGSTAFTLQLEHLRQTKSDSRQGHRQQWRRSLNSCLTS